MVFGSVWMFKTFIYLKESAKVCTPVKWVIVHQEIIHLVSDTLNKEKKTLTAKTVSARWVSCNSRVWTIFHPLLSFLPLFLSLDSSWSSVPPPGRGLTPSLTDENASSFPPSGPFPPHHTPPTTGQIRASLADLTTPLHTAPDHTLMAGPDSSHTHLVLIFAFGQNLLLHSLSITLWCPEKIYNCVI